MRALRRIAVLAVLAAAAAALVASLPASAETDTPGVCDEVVRHPTDPNSNPANNTYACEWGSHHIRVCDRHVDGHRARAWFIGQFNPARQTATGWAPSQGCHTQGTAYGSGLILRFKVCVEYEQPVCSGWKEP